MKMRTREIQKLMIHTRKQDNRYKRCKSLLAHIKSRSRIISQNKAAMKFSDKERTDNPVRKNKS
jgi:hypothetical protein